MIQDSLDNFDHLLFVPSVKTNVGAFLVAAPTLSNSLPVSVKSAGNITTKT